jgi:CRP/FNR family transcriptional regulator, cyclic AMP receptor protein
MDTLLQILKHSPIFSGMSEAGLQVMGAKFSTRTLGAGEVLFQLGDPGEEMIVVLSGKLAIFMPDKDKPQAGQAIRIFAPGEMLGEMALIDRLPRSASARAEVDSTIAVLDLASFEDLLANYPDVASGLMKGLSSRIRYTTDFIGEVRQWVQRMAEGNYGAIKANDDVQDNSLAALAAEFVRMAAQVREREEKLQREVAQLKIQIDDKKRQEDFKEITESEYYVNLKAKLRAMRDSQQED